MPDLRWLEGYNGESVDELIALEGKCRTDSLVLAFEQAMDQKAARIGEDELTAEERIILAIEALEREVNNGGYGQFFLNSSREYAPIIADALRRISCPKTAEITQKALKIVQKTPMTEEVHGRKTRSAKTRAANAILFTSSGPKTSKRLCSRSSKRIGRGSSPNKALQAPGAAPAGKLFRSVVLPGTSL